MSYKKISFMKTWFIIISFSIFLISCSSKKVENTTSLSSATLFKKPIPEHPRLLFSKTEERQIKELMKSDSILEKLTLLLREEADKALALPMIDSPNNLSKSREHVYRVITLGMAYRLFNDETYAEGVEKILIHLCQYPGWNPSHYLDVAETTAAVAIGYDWLHDYLSDDSKKQIEEAIRTNALNLSIPVYEATGNKGSWAKRETNWNVVCNTGMTLGALAIADIEPLLAEKVITYSVQFVPNCLKHYAPDGVCYEGPGYWEFTNIYLALLLKSLNDNLGHDFGISDLSGVSETASYYVQSLSPAGQVFNFANSGSKASSASPLFFYFGDTFNQPEVIHHYNSIITDIIEGKRTQPKWDFFLSVAWYKPSAGTPEPVFPPLQVFRNDMNPIIAFNGDRTTDGSIYLSAKGGDPDEAHQQLDVGSFIIEVDGIRWADDLGADKYSLPGFWDYKPDGQRWDYFRNTNFSHNTLAIDNKLQHSRGKGILSDYRTEGEEPFGIIDMSTVYQNQATSVLRGFKLLDDNTMLIQDEISLLPESKTVTWSLITSADIEIDGNTAVLKSYGKQFCIKAVSPSNVRLQVEDAKPFTDKEYHISGYRMLKITADSAELNGIPIAVLAGSNKAQVDRHARQELGAISSWK